MTKGRLRRNEARSRGHVCGRESRPDSFSLLQPKSFEDLFHKPTGHPRSFCRHPKKKALFDSCGYIHTNTDLVTSTFHRIKFLTTHMNHWHFKIRLINFMSFEHQDIASCMGKGKCCIQKYLSSIQIKTPCNLHTFVVNSSWLYSHHVNVNLASRIIWKI